MRRSRPLLLLAGALGAAAFLAGCSSATPAAVHASTTITPTPLPTIGALPSGPFPAPTVAALQKALDASVRDGGSADALASVITADGIWTGASGVDGPHGRKAEPDDVFPIASITKTFTAALVFKLAEEHRMNLDAKLSTYLTGRAAEISNSATVRQALAMRAGIPDTTDASRTAALAVPSKRSTVDDVVAAMPEPTAKPGALPDPSNPTYKLLALAAERAGHDTWADLVRTELVAPAHVPGTLLVQVPGARTPGVWAMPTPAGPWGIGGTLPFAADTSFSHGATDMAADSRSLGIWAWTLLDGRIVSAASLAEMASTDGTEVGSGLDPLSGGVPGGSVGHLGTKDGLSAVLVTNPAERAVIVVAMNADDQSVDTVAGTLLQALDG